MVMSALRDGSREYKRWRKLAAKEFNCDEAGIDLAVTEGCESYMQALRNDNIFAQRFHDIYKDSFTPMFFVGFSWWIYRQNTTLKMMMDSGKFIKSPYQRPVLKVIKGGKDAANTERDG
jgi:hypothetical protein